MVELDGQGLPFDEIPLAPGSFLYLGKAPYPPHTVLAVGNIPLLAVTYVGALKSNVYGVMMKFFRVKFSVVSWRLVGILFVASGLMFFTIALINYLSIESLFTFLVLVCTDVTIVLYTRVDWGPMALSLTCRIVWIALWLREEYSQRISPIAVFFLGFIPAFLVYEKLNNIVFFLPLVALILFSKERRTLSYLRVLFSGILIGGLPFLLINMFTHGISFQQLGEHSSIALSSRLPFFSFVKIFLGLGAGQEVKNFILGDEPIGWIKHVEIILVSFLLIGSAGFSYVYRQPSGAGRIALVSVFLYYALALSTWLLPRGTGIHHWIVSSPFQYAAIAMALPLFRKTNSPALTNLRKFFPVVLVSLILCRIFNLFDVETSLLHCHYSPSWDRDLTTITQYIADHHADGNFIAADYGFGAQVYCFSSGDFVLPEPFWKYTGPGQLREMIKIKKNKPVYVIYNSTPSVVSNEMKEHILTDLHHILNRQMLPLEPELQTSGGIIVEKYPSIE